MVYGFFESPLATFEKRLYGSLRETFSPIGRNPRRSMEGASVCQIVMATRIKKMTMKKIAVGSVHSIQVKRDVQIIFSIIEL